MDELQERANEIPKQDVLRDALLDGASALRYRASRLAGMAPLTDDEQAAIEAWRTNASVLAALACTEVTVKA